MPTTDSVGTGHSCTVVEEPRREAYGQVVVFLDPYGNKWDRVQRTGDQAAP